MLQANGFATLCLLRWEQSTGGGLLWITEALERLEELGVSSRLLQATLQIVVQPHEVPQVDWFGSWMKSGPLDALQCDHTPKPCCVSSSTARSYTSESPFCLAALVFPEHKLHACTPPEEHGRANFPDPCDVHQGVVAGSGSGCPGCGTKPPAAPALSTEHQHRGNELSRPAADIQAEGCYQ